jgi:hypothetical protein
MKDIAAMLRNESRDGGNDTLSVRATEQEDGRFFHFMNRVIQA